MDDTVINENNQYGESGLELIFNQMINEGWPCPKDPRGLGEQLAELE